MKISSVARYRGETYKLDFESGETIFLNAETVMLYSLHEGTEITPEDFETLLSECALRTAKERAFYLLEKRDYSYREMFNKLNRNYGDETCINICDKMAELGLIDDRKYAVKLAEHLIRTKKYGESRAKYEMKLKGLTDGVIEDALEALREQTPDILAELIDKKYARKLTDKRATEKVKASLARMGYSYSDINRALNDYFDKIDSEGDT